MPKIPGVLNLQQNYTHIFVDINIENLRKGGTDKHLGIPKMMNFI